MWPLDSGRLDALAIIVAFVWLVTAALPGQQCGPPSCGKPDGGRESHRRHAGVASAPGSGRAELHACPIGSRKM